MSRLRNLCLAACVATLIIAPVTAFAGSGFKTPLPPVKTCPPANHGPYTSITSKTPCPKKPTVNAPHANSSIRHTPTTHRITTSSIVATPTYRTPVNHGSHTTTHRPTCQQSCR